MNDQNKGQVGAPTDPVTHPDVPHSKTPTEPEGLPDPPPQPEPPPEKHSSPQPGVDTDGTPAAQE